MDPISAVVSGLSLTVIVVVSVVLYINAEKAQKSLDGTVKEVVDQINDSQYYAYRFDKKQEENIKNTDNNIQLVNKKVQETNTALTAKEQALSNEISRVEAASVPKTALTSGIPYSKFGKVQLGEEYLLSGVGDALSDKKDAPDGWLRLMDKEGKALHPGGLAASKLWAKDSTSLGTTAVGTNIEAKGTLTVKGAPSSYNPTGLPTVFADTTTGTNNIRGNTIVFGNAATIGNTNVAGNLNVVNRIHFRDTAFDVSGTGTNATDSYYMEKKVAGDNKSSLRLTINDDADESFQVWGGSCATGNCSGEGAMRHRFDAMGNAWHELNAEAQNVKGRNSVIVGNGATPTAWIRANGDAYTSGKQGVGIHPDQFADYRMVVDGGPNGKFNTLFRNGTTTVQLANNTHQGLRIDTQSAGQEAALQVYSATGELMSMKNNGAVRIGRTDGAGEVLLDATNTKVRRGIDANTDWANANDKALLLGPNSRKVVLGNNQQSGFDFARAAAPALDAVVSTNPTYVHKTLKVDRTAMDQYPANWPSGIHTSFLYANNTIGAGTTGTVNAYMNSQGDIFTSKGALTGSDISLKEDVKPISPQEIDSLASLKPVSYTLKADTDKQRKFGFIAQDVEKVYPNIVTDSKAGVKALNYDSFVPLVVGKIQKTLPDSKRLCLGDTCITEEELARLKKVL